MKVISYQRSVKKEGILFSMWFALYLTSPLCLLLRPVSRLAEGEILRGANQLLNIIDE